MNGIGVVELRRYTLHPGGRERLIELFERELIEPQEDVGLEVLGHFRDSDAPDAFVWLRGFADMVARRRGLEAFYGGPVWARHADEANATMIDSDDVLLLRPLGARDDLLLDRDARPAHGEASAPTDGLVLTTYGPAAGVADEDITRVVAAAGVRAAFRTLRAPNDFPRLPVREGEDVLVTVTDDPPGDWRAISASPAHVARLVPCARSLLRP